MTLNIEDAQKITDISNEYIEKLIKSFAPSNYENNESIFINLVLTGPLIISGTLINKLSGMYKIDREKLFYEYIQTLNTAFKFIDIGKNEIINLLNE
jgi:hypothetical protein